MVSVIGEEFLAFSTTTSGNVPALVPLVALFRYDNDNVEFRDLCKQDIMRIPAPSLSSTLVGGWLFRLSQPAESVYNATWVKRFVIIQGELVLLSDSPKLLQLKFLIEFFLCAIEIGFFLSLSYS